MTNGQPPPPSGGMEPATRGFVFALAAFGFWGLLPLFLKLVAHLPAIEVVAHRVLWSIPIAAAVLVALGRTNDLKRALRSPRTLLLATLTAAMISVNWSLYVWAIFTDRAMDTALGYYMTPLISVLMGSMLLGERLSRGQMVAVGLAVAGVGILTMDAGGLPWISLVLSISFTFYGFLRKTLPIGPSQGFLLEVLILGVPALLYAGWLHAAGNSSFVPSTPADMLLLAACGPATAVPLLLFGFGARLLRFSTLGLMQYIAPTIVFLIAVFIFREPFSGLKAVSFGLIWTALAVYSWSTLSQRDSAGRQIAGG